MLLFEKVKTTDSALEDFESFFSVWRAKVPGGWLIKVTNHVMTMNVDNGRIFNPKSGFETRDSICFMPDPKHKWQ